MPNIKGLIEDFDKISNPTRKECEEVLVEISRQLTDSPDDLFGGNSSAERYDLSSLITQSLKHLADPTFPIEFLAKLLKVTNQHKIYLWDQTGVAQALLPQINTLLTQVMNKKGPVKKQPLQLEQFRKVHDLFKQYEIVAVLAEAGLNVTSLVRHLFEKSLVSSFQAASVSSFQEGRKQQAKREIFKFTLNMLYSLSLFFASRPSLDEVRNIYEFCRALLKDVTGAIPDLSEHDVRRAMVKLRKVCAFYAVREYYDVVTGELNKNPHNPLRKYSLNQILLTGQPSAPQALVAKFIRANDSSSAVTEEVLVEPGYCLDILCVRSTSRSAVEYDGQHHRQHNLDGSLRNNSMSARDNLRDFLLKQLGYSIIHLSSNQFRLNSGEARFFDLLRGSDLLALINAMQNGQAKVIHCSPAVTPKQLGIFKKPAPTSALAPPVEKLEKPSLLGLPPVIGNGLFARPNALVVLFECQDNAGAIFYAQPGARCAVFSIGNIYYASPISSQVPMLVYTHDMQKAYEVYYPMMILRQVLVSAEVSAMPVLATETALIVKS